MELKLKACKSIKKLGASLIGNVFGKQSDSKTSPPVNILSEADDSYLPYDVVQHSRQTQLAARHCPTPDKPVREASHESAVEKFSSGFRKPSQTSQVSDCHRADAFTPACKGSSGQARTSRKSKKAHGKYHESFQLENFFDCPIVPNCKCPYMQGADTTPGHLCAPIQVALQDGTCPGSKLLPVMDPNDSAYELKGHRSLQKEPVMHAKEATLVQPAPDFYTHHDYQRQQKRFCSYTRRPLATRGGCYLCYDAGITELHVRPSRQSTKMPEHNIVSWDFQNREKAREYTDQEEASDERLLQCLRPAPTNDHRASSQVTRGKSRSICPSSSGWKDGDIISFQGLLYQVQVDATGRESYLFIGKDCVNDCMS